MEIVDVRPAGLGNAAARDHGQETPESSFFPNPQPAGISIDAGSNKPLGTVRTGEVRSIVERRFMSMNEAHDRIRTELLGSHDPVAE